MYSKTDLAYRFLTYVDILENNWRSSLIFVT